MTISRAQVATHLNSQFSVLAAQVTQTASDDSAAGYGPDIDQALRWLGTEEASIPTATVADATRNAYLALSEYYALRRFARKLALKVTVALGPQRREMGQIYGHVVGLMADAATYAAGLGYSVDGSSGWGLVEMTLDLIEPEPTTE